MTKYRIVEDEKKIISPTKKFRIIEEEKNPIGERIPESLLNSIQRKYEKNILGNMFGHVGSQISKAFGANEQGPFTQASEKIGYGAIPFFENLPGGYREGLTSAVNSLRGERSIPEEIPEEYGAGFGRKVGRLAGQSTIAAPITAAISATGGAAGYPILGSLLGAGLGYGATTEGSLFDKLLSGLEAASIPGGLKLLSSSKKLKSSNIAKNVLKGKEETKQRVKNIFDDVIKESEGVKLNTKDIKINKKLLDSDSQYALNKFLKTPTVENAHSAQKDLAKFSSIAKKDTTISYDSREYAKKLAKELRNRIDEGLRNSGKKEIADKYKQGRQLFKEEFVPYKESKAIQKLENNKLRPKKFAKQIGQEEAFLSSLGEKHPEIELRNNLLKALKLAGTGLTLEEILSGRGTRALNKILP